MADLQLTPGLTLTTGLGDASVFAGWIYDSIDHALGGGSHLATNLELQADPSLSAMVAAGQGVGASPAQQQIAAGVTADVTAAEDQTQVEQAAQAKEAAGKALDAIGSGISTAIAAIPSPVKWTGGILLAIGAVVAVGYTVRAFR